MNKANLTNFENDSSVKDLERFLTFKSISTKVIAVLLLVGFILYSSISYLIEQNINDLAYNMTLSRGRSDFNYLEDIIRKRTSAGTEAEWDIIDGCLCYGGVVIGDGTDEKAYFTPFFETENKTGAFCYAFMKTDDKGLYGEGLGYVGDEKTGFREGHFIRTAGSTRGKMGESIVGTYIDKKIADILDRDEEYSGPATVSGKTIYCYYKLLKNRHKKPVGCMVVGRSISEIVDATQSIKDEAKGISVLIIFVSIALLIAIIGSWLSAIKKINSHVKILTDGTFPDKKLEVNSNDEMAELADNINDMIVSLKEKERIGSELNVATGIQAHMLPTNFPAFPEFENIDLYASMKPAKEVAGDFYDFFKVDEDHIACVVADVSGKGVPAALFMVIAKTLIKNYSLAGYSPADVFTNVNNLLLESENDGLFVTAWMLMLNVKTGEIVYVNAGHNPPVYYTKEKGFEYLHSQAGLVLAGMEDIVYKQYTMNMKKGDKIFIYTDGVTEATNLTEELYGEDRLLKFLNENTNLSAKEMIAGVKSSIDEFVGEAEQFDDITMLCLEYK